MSEQNGQLIAVEGAVSTVKAVNKGGRPTKYRPETIDKLLATIGDGLTLKQACVASGISESALSDWRERYPELEPRLEQARETARQKALAGIKAAGEAGDWRAWECYLRMSFASDYRKDAASVNVTATATAQQVGVVCDEATRAKLIEQRERLLATATPNDNQNALGEAQRSLPAIPESSAAMSKKV
jgi:hypothetical protein